MLYSDAIYNSHTMIKCTRKTKLKKKKLIILCWSVSDYYYLLCIILDYTVIKKQVFNNTLKVHKLNLTQTQF